MILSSHIIVASALSAPLINQPLGFLNSALIFILSLISHFLIDMIPHWDYKVAFVEKFKEARKSGFPVSNKEFKILFKADLIKFLFDGILGISLSFLIFNFPIDFEKILMFGFAVFGGILPDVLTVFYFIKKEPFLKFFWQFHNFIHGRRVSKDRFLFGAILQILTIAAIVLLIEFAWG